MPNNGNVTPGTASALTLTQLTTESRGTTVSAKATEQSMDATTTIVLVIRSPLYGLGRLTIVYCWEISGSLYK